MKNRNNYDAICAVFESSIAAHYPVDDLGDATQTCWFEYIEEGQVCGFMRLQVWSIVELAK